MADLRSSIELYEKSVRCWQPDCSGKPAILRGLGISYRLLFECRGEVDDLSRSTACMEQALHLTPVGHPRRPDYLNSLGSSYIYVFKLTSQLDDLNKSIDLLKQAVQLAPDGHPDKSGYFNNLGNSYICRFERLGRLDDMKISINCQEQAVMQSPDGHPYRPGCLSSLGNSYTRLFDLLGRLSDLDKSIGYHEQAIDMTPTGHRNKPDYLHNLGSSYIRLYQRLWRPSDLDKAIGCQEQAVRQTPDNHPHKSTRLDSLGVLYVWLFDRLGRLSDLDNSVSCHTRAVALTPDGKPNKPGQLGNLGASYARLYQYLGRLSDLSKALKYQEQAMLQLPDGHPHKFICLSTLGVLYNLLFERSGALNDLEHSLRYHSQANDLTPVGHPDKPGYLTNLGNSYTRLYERLWRLSDLDKSISCYEQAITLTPDDDPHKPGFFCNVGISYSRLFQHLGKLSDLEKSIKWQQQAVAQTPDGHPNKSSYSSNLGNSYSCLFDRLGRLNDLNLSIRYHEQGVVLTPDGHADRPIRITNLADSYEKLFLHSGCQSDLDKSFNYRKQALALIPDAHPAKSSYLDKLGLSYMDLFLHLGRATDAEQAADYLKQAEQLCLRDPHSRFTHLHHLGNLYHHISIKSKERLHALTAMGFYREAVLLSAGYPSRQIYSSRRWARLAFALDIAPLEAYTHCISLLPQVVWLGTTMQHQHECIGHDVQDLVAEAAAVAILSQRYDLAIEWLEQGRSIVWGQILQLRTPVDELSVAYPELAQELRWLSNQLEIASMPQSIVQSLAEDEKSSHEISRGHRRLAERREGLLGYIRHLPGLERFLLPLTAQNLIVLVQNGAVVTVNICNERCDALVIRAGDHAISVIPLPRFSHQKAQNARKELRMCLAGRGSHRWIEQLRPSSDFKPILALLWHDIVKPVLDHLAITYDPLVEDLPHITWCTTGSLSFLPLHAAGDYSHPSTILHNLAISSYVPTISSLSDQKPSSDSYSGILAVGHESSVRGLSPLPGTKAELDQVATHAKSTRFTRLDGEKATTDSVLQSMADHSWVHFACHGSQNSSEPMKSALHLHDKDLDLATIARTPLKNAQLAFLSACQTAAGDSTLPDESIHLAAGLLMAGYPTVIATLWSISDKDAPLVAGKVYECLLENGVPDSRKVAKALHIAVKCLRESIGEDQFVRWIPYVHIGR